MGESTAQFIAQQQRLGSAQGKSFQQLAQGSAAYMKELDELAKLTGQSREAQQEQIKAQLREGRFLSTRRLLERQGEAGVKASNELQKLSLATGAYNDELSSAIRDASSGIIDSDVVKQFTVAGVDLLRAVEKIKSGGGDAQTVFKDLQRQVQQVLPAQEQFAQTLDAGNKTFPTLYKNVDFAAASFDTAGAKAEQKGVQDNKLTGNAADAQKSLEQMSRQMSALATSILPNFSTAISKLTDVMNQGMQKMGVPGVVGGKTSGAVAPGAAGAAPGVVGAAGAATSRRDLIDQGLRVKAGDVQAEGSGVSPKLIELAKRIQSEVPGFQYFSGFNDRFHQEKSPSSTHTKGLAADFTVAPTPSAEQGRTIANQLKSMGFATVIDEYNNPSAKATAGHFHAAISAQNGFQGLISGPKSGYRPNIIMHGEEELSIKPKPAGGSMDMMDRLGNSMGEQMDMMGAQLSALENLVSAMRDQNSISTKILQATNN